MTIEPDARTDAAGTTPVALHEISALLSEVAQLSAERGVPLSRRLDFHQRKAELLTRLAADEPDNPDRQAAAQQAQSQYEHLAAIVERGRA